MLGASLGGLIRYETRFHVCHRVHTVLISGILPKQNLSVARVPNLKVWDLGCFPIYLNGGGCLGR